MTELFDLAHVDTGYTVFGSIMLETAPKIGDIIEMPEPMVGTWIVEGMSYHKRNERQILNVRVTH